MNRLPLLAVALALTSCTILPTQHGKAQFFGDYTNIDFSDGSVHFHADTMNHSKVVRAHWHGAVLLGSEAVSSAIPGVGVGTRAAAVAIPSIVSGMTQPPRSTPSPSQRVLVSPSGRIIQPNAP